MKSKVKIFIFWSIFISLDFLIAAGIAEVWIRLFIPVQNVCYNHDPVLGDRNCPNQKTYGYVEPGYSSILETNSDGFHDIERKKDKNKGTLRLQIYGDSLIGGIGVPTNKTIPSLVETYLNTDDASFPVEVMNMAPAEDSTCSQLLTYRLIGKNYSPDVVICHFMCDFRDNMFETHQRTRSPYFTIDKENNLTFVPPVPVDMTKPVERLKKSSLLVRLLANKLLASKFYNDLSRLKDNIISFRFTRKKDDQPTSENQNSHRTHQQYVEHLLTEKSWPLTMRILQKFKKEVEEGGGNFILIDGIRFTPNIAGIYTNKDLALFCQGNNITYIPVYDEYLALKKAPPDKNYLLKDDHPTSLGNEILSKIVAEKLNNQLKKIAASREGFHE